MVGLLFVCFSFKISIIGIGVFVDLAVRENKCIIPLFEYGFGELPCSCLLDYYLRKEKTKT